MNNSPKKKLATAARLSNYIYVRVASPDWSIILYFSLRRDRDLQSVLIRVMQLSYLPDQRQRPLLSPLSYWRGLDFRGFITALEELTEQKFGQESNPQPTAYEVPHVLLGREIPFS